MAGYSVIIPAAGIGARMQSGRPKQYISINNKTILEYTLDCFLPRADIEVIVVALARHDQYWPRLAVSKNNKILVTEGGEQRFHSVLNGLHALSGRLADNDWVLVHDAARPCLNQILLDRLIARVSRHETGGILALPCRDTMKRGNEQGEIEATVEREKLWHAQTPQMFRYGKLLAALSKARAEKYPVTDEAMAMELCGHKPLLVQGDADNIKLTHKGDLENVAACLQQAGLSATGRPAPGTGLPATGGSV